MVRLTAEKLPPPLLHCGSDVGQVVVDGVDCASAPRNVAYTLRSGGGSAVPIEFQVERGTHTLAYHDLLMRVVAPPLPAGGSNDASNPHTVDGCKGIGVCTHATKPDLANCDDGNLCTADSCVAALGCVHSSSCDDSDGCTDDSCDAQTGVCSHTAVQCNGTALSCHALQCVNGGCAQVPVADGASCAEATPGECEVAQCVGGVCTVVPLADGMACSGVLTGECEVAQCVSGVCTAVAVPDGAPVQAGQACTSVTPGTCGLARCLAGQCEEVSVLNGVPCSGPTPSVCHENQCWYAVCVQVAQPDWTQCTSTNPLVCHDYRCMAGACGDVGYASAGTECAVPGAASDCGAGNCNAGGVCLSDTSNDCGTGSCWGDLCANSCTLYCNADGTCGTNCCPNGCGGGT